MKINLQGLTAHEKQQVKAQLRDSALTGFFSGRIVPGTRSNNNGPLFSSPDKPENKGPKQLNLF